MKVTAFVIRALKFRRHVRDLERRGFSQAHFSAPYLPYRKVFDKLEVGPDGTSIWFTTKDAEEVRG